MRTPSRCPAEIAESGPSTLIESIQPLVARFPTNPVPRTQVGHGVQGQLMIANEAFSLFHRCRLQPGHRSTSQSIPSVVVSPMFPVCSVTYVPGLYRWDDNKSLHPTALRAAGEVPRYAERSSSRFSRWVLPNAVVAFDPRSSRSKYTSRLLSLKIALVLHQQRRFLRGGAPITWRTSEPRLLALGPGQSESRASRIGGDDDPLASRDFVGPHEHLAPVGLDCPGGSRN